MSLFRPFTPVILVPDCPPCRLCTVSFVTTALASLPLHHQKGFLVANQRIYHHIENGGRKWVALGHPSLSVEGCTVVTSCPLYHIQTLSIVLEEEKVPGPHAITLQDN